jgi:thiol-disulfide isomerase/thioredoxin
MLPIEIFTRLAWTIVLIGFGLAAWWLANRWILQRASHQGAALSGSGTPSILYFTTPTCAPCKTFQRPALERLQQILGECLKVIEVDATAQPELAAQWGVLSVPTTFVLDEKGTARHVNHGPTGVEKLLKQLQTL